MRRLTAELQDRGVGERCASTATTFLSSNADTEGHPDKITFAPSNAVRSDSSRGPPTKKCTLTLSAVHVSTEARWPVHLRALSLILFSSTRSSETGSYARQLPFFLAVSSVISS